MSEWYRQYYLIPALEKIAAQPTWHLQRAEAIRTILDEIHWRSWEHCMKEAKTEMGKDIIYQKLKELWPKASNEELSFYLFQFFLVTICVAAAIGAIAKTFYKLDDVKESQIELCHQYQRDIMRIDYQIMDLIDGDVPDNVEQAYAIVEWKEQMLDPINIQMYRHLTSMKEQIARDTFDINEFVRISDDFQAQKTALAEQLRAS
jgi:hypothetical protein